MKKSLKVLMLSVFAVLLCIGSAGAITFTDTTFFTENGTTQTEDYIDHGMNTVNYLSGPYDYVSWTHHFKFDTLTPYVLSGTLTLALYDDENDPWWQPFEFALGLAEDGTWGFGEVDTASYSYNINASYLEDGSFSVLLGFYGVISILIDPI